MPPRCGAPVARIGAAPGCSPAAQPARAIDAAAATASEHRSEARARNAARTAPRQALHPSDEWVEVTVLHDDSHLLIRVADSGPGMSADQFARSASRGYSTKDSHRGLGLALVNQIVARYGGTIEAQREPYAAVVVTIPVGPS